MWLYSTSILSTPPPLFTLISPPFLFQRFKPPFCLPRLCIPGSSFARSNSWCLSNFQIKHVKRALAHTSMAVTRLWEGNGVYVLNGRDISQFPSTLTPSNMQSVATARRKRQRSCWIFTSFWGRIRGHRTSYYTKMLGQYTKIGHDRNPVN